MTASKETIGNDEGQVVQLREWGTDRIWKLAEPFHASRTIGESHQCQIRIAERGISAMHAVVTHRRGSWWIEALAGSRVELDGTPCDESPIMPGVEISVGRTTLVAECQRTAALRPYLRRILGWGKDRAFAAEHARRAIRSALLHRSTIVLVGESDLAPIAQTLHRYICGDDAPFVFSDRRRRNGTASGAVRGPVNASDIGQAYERAQGGSLCVRAARLPIDGRFIESICEPQSDVRLFVLLRDVPNSFWAGLAGPFPIWVPPMALREQELPRIIDEYIADAIPRLEAPPNCINATDRLWIAQRCAASLHEIEQAAMRLVVLKTSDTLQEAGTRLGMAAVSLARWIRRRSPLPPDLEYLQTRTVHLDALASIDAAAWSGKVSAS